MLYNVYNEQLAKQYFVYCKSSENDYNAELKRLYEMIMSQLVQTLG